ncbi:hypothetical protein D3C75_505620 [compost metagenome]
MRLQTGCQIAVQFDDGQFIQTFTYRFGQCGQTWTDLDHCLAFLWIDSRNNTFDHELIVEEVLPETFTG